MYDNLHLMKNKILVLLISIFLFSCSHKKQIVILNDVKNQTLKKLDVYKEDYIVLGDILKIDVTTTISEVSLPYNNVSNNLMQANNLDILLVNGYLVDKDSTINFPVLGQINVVGLTATNLSEKLKNLLVTGGHLTNPHVKVKKVNSKFSVLGEVNNPGTFINYDNQLNIFQALGIAGDLTITAKRNSIVLIRTENGLRKSYKFSLTNSKLFDQPYYYIKSNDIIIVEPNFSKIKSAGFIGSPASIASIASLLLSITLLIINN